jgi:hypothetical protein
MMIQGYRVLNNGAECTQHSHGLPGDHALTTSTHVKHAA